jgi:hypothetical protein
MILAPGGTVCEQVNGGFFWPMNSMGSVAGALLIAGSEAGLLGEAGSVSGSAENIQDWS